MDFLPEQRLQELNLVLQQFLEEFGQPGNAFGVIHAAVSKRRGIIKVATKTEQEFKALPNPYRGVVLGRDFQYDVVQHALAGHDFSSKLRPARARNPVKEELKCFTPAENGFETWITAPDDGFYGHIIRIPFPAQTALIINLYHSFATDHVREYTSFVEGNVSCQPLWMLGREIGYILTWNEEQETSGKARLTLINPDRREHPFVIDLSMEDVPPVVTVASEQSANNQLSIEVVASDAVKCTDLGEYGNSLLRQAEADVSAGRISEFVIEQRHQDDGHES